MVPVEVSVKLTSSGTVPLVGLPTKLATGKMAPAPSRTLVLPPPLLAKTTVLLKLPSVAGVKLTTTLVLPRPGTVNEEPDTTANGPPVTCAVPFVIVKPPMLVTRIVRCELVPTATVPKLTFEVAATNKPGVTAEPVTELVELPPLLVKTTALLKLPPVLGPNAT